MRVPAAPLLFAALGLSPLAGCSGRAVAPTPDVLPGSDAPPASATGLTPGQQAEIDAAVAAYRQANAAPAKPPPRVQAVAAATTPPPLAERVSWLDPGGTGLPEEKPVAAVEPVAAAAVDAPPPAPRLPETSPEPLELPAAPPPAVDAVPGDGLVEIATLELCRSVGGFGVYEPFEDTTFTAGVSVRMVLYAEIAGYATDTTPAAGGDAEGGGGEQMHRVRLAQEVRLFRDADGLMVWSQPPEPIRDESRRRRRDFWSVQMVELPANLGVGRYRLKVRITDEVSGTVDERSVPLRLVADAR